MEYQHYPEPHAAAAVSACRPARKAAGAQALEAAAEAAEAVCVDDAEAGRVV